MRVDIPVFKKVVCKKCKRYMGDKPIFGKCLATDSQIYNCARRKMFGYEEWHDEEGKK